MAGFTRGHCVGFLGNLCVYAFQFFCKISGQLFAHTAFKFGGFRGVSGAIGGELRVPRSFAFRTFGGGVPCSFDVCRNHERLVRPAEGCAGGGDFIRAERRAVYVVRALFIRRAFADHGFAADQRRFAVGSFGLCLGGEQGCFDGSGIVAIDIGNHVPAVGGKACRCVIREPVFDMAVNRNAVVIPERDQFG